MLSERRQTQKVPCWVAPFTGSPGMDRPMQLAGCQGGEGDKLAGAGCTTLRMCKMS